MDQKSYHWHGHWFDSEMDPWNPVTLSLCVALPVSVVIVLFLLSAWLLSFLGR